MEVMQRITHLISDKEVRPVSKPPCVKWSEHAPSTMYMKRASQTYKCSNSYSTWVTPKPTSAVPADGSQIAVPTLSPAPRIGLYDPGTPVKTEAVPPRNRRVVCYQRKYVHMPVQDYPSLRWILPSTSIRRMSAPFWQPGPPEPLMSPRRLLEIIGRYIEE